MDSRRFRTSAGKPGFKTVLTEGYNFTEAFDELDTIADETAGEPAKVEAGKAVTEGIDKMSDDDIRRMVATARGVNVISEPVTPREKEVDQNILMLTRDYMKQLEQGIITQDQFNAAFKTFIGIDPKTGRYNPAILFDRNHEWNAQFESMVAECKTRLNECGQAKAEDAEPTSVDQTTADDQL